MQKHNWTQDVYLRAWDFACLAHKGQVYKGPQPGIVYEYSNHPAAVAMEVSHALLQHPDYDGDLAMQCALLHDTIEDTPVRYQDLLKQFGKAVADGVAALSKNASLPKNMRMEDSLRRICQQPREVWLVKLADRINNLQYVPPHWPAERVKEYRSEAYMILETLGMASPLLAQRLAEHIWSYGKELQDQLTFAQAA
jgi:(p)ppGpp synthase/HD superfamily hydrolase